MNMARARYEHDTNTARTRHEHGTSSSGGTRHAPKLLHGVGIHLARHRDDAAWRHGAAVSQALHDIKARHAGHADVQQHDVDRPAAIEERRCLDA
jgi:hypothetical protein